MSKKNAESRGDSSSLMAALTKAAHGAYQTGIYTGAESDKAIVGLPLLHLCQRWFYQSSVYPLGRMHLLVGKTESCKSAYLAEIIRWHADCGGFGMVRGTEGRDIKDLRDSILGYRDACSYEECESVEHWQTGLTTAIKGFHAAWTKNPDQFPVCFGVDSLRGARSKKVNDDIDSLGYADPHYSPEAKQFYAYFSYISKRLEGMPLSLVVTNHLLEAINDGGRRGKGPPGIVFPGGEGQKYFSTLVTQLTKIKDIRSSKHQGRRLLLKTLKNSLGSDARLQLEVEMVWWHQDGLQRTAWDWHKATIEKLVWLQGEKNKDDPKQRKALRELIRIDTCNRGKNGKGVYSEALGIPKSDPVSFKKAGELLESNTALLAELEPILHIKQRAAHPVAAQAVTWAASPVEELPDLDDEFMSESDGDFEDDATGEEYDNADA